VPYKENKINIILRYIYFTQFSYPRKNPPYNITHIQLTYYIKLDYNLVTRVKL
jgi:hypothetical protein